MSMQSRCTIGAMASKNASAFSPVSCAIAAARAGEVSGPVAMMTLSHSGGRQRDFAALERDQRMGGQRRRDRRGKAVAVDRQRAAGRHLIGVGGAHDQRAEPAHLLMQQADGVVVLDRRSGTSSSRRVRHSRRSCARRSARSGRISCSTTGTPACASCQAASEPARPPPTMCRRLEIGSLSLR